MSRNGLLRLLGLCVACACAMPAQQTFADSVVASCLKRDTATTWMEMSATWNTERPGSWSNDSLRGVLVELAQRDQSIRNAPNLSDSARNPDFVKRLAARDSADLVELRKIVAKFGWPTRSMVGARGASAAILIAQHNEPYQPDAVRLIKALPKGEYQASELAMLEDRILAYSGRPQRYATQVKPVTGDVAEFYPIDSIGRVEARRAEVGLPPMAIYLCMTEGFTGRKVKYPPK